MIPEGNLFPKQERLCSRKAIETLFTGGNRAFSAFPLRVVYRVMEGASTQVLFSVSKRHFKHAVDRNRTKRQLRESWRRNRDILPDAPLHIAFIWLSDELQPTEFIVRKMKNLLHRIQEDLCFADSSSSPSAFTSDSSVQ